MDKTTLNCTNAEKIIGELVMLIPLVLLVWAMALLFPVVAAMITFFIGKWAYDKNENTHFHLEEKDCIKTTYLVFIILGILYAGLQSTFPLGNQPLIPIILGMILTFIWAQCGDIQAKLNNVNHKKQKKYKLSQPEIKWVLNNLRMFTLKERDVIELHYVQGKYIVDVAAEMDVTSRTIDSWIKDIKTKVKDNMP